jgi:hypothetical protein
MDVFWIAIGLIIVVPAIVVGVNDMLRRRRDRAAGRRRKRKIRP